MNIPEISIIVPAYNSARTIERTLLSLIQNSIAIEIICVDDGSTDDTSKIIQKMRERDNRIRLVSGKNAGASTARNKGIDLAKGRYLMFCDADDEYDTNTIGYIADDINCFQPDIIVFGRETIFDNDVKIQWLPQTGKCQLFDWDWPKYFNDVIVSRGHSNVVFNRVYKMQVINQYNIRFNKELTLSEDLLFNFCYMQYAKKCLEDTRAKYIQHKVSGSLTTNARPDYYEQDKKVISLIRRDYADKAYQFSPFLDRHLLNTTERAVYRALIGRDADNNVKKRAIIRRVLNNRDFIQASKRYHDNNKYFMAKIKLLANKQVFLYKIRFIILPKIKERIVKNGQR